MSATLPSVLRGQFVAAASIHDCFEVLRAPRALDLCAQIWARCSMPERMVWLHASCLAGDLCTSQWVAFTRTEKSELFLGLENMVEFFQKLGGAE